MQRRKLLLSLLIIALAASVVVWYYQPQEEESVHYHAAFHVYVDGQRADFAKPEYMHVEPCTEHEEEPTPAQERGERAHLHDLIGDIVHVHRANVTWGDLFTNLTYTFGEGPVVGYRDGTTIPNVLTTVIQPDDRLLIVQGTLGDEQVAYDALPTVEDIRGVESASESCGT